MLHMLWVQDNWAICLRRYAPKGSDVTLASFGSGLTQAGLSELGATQMVSATTPCDRLQAACQCQALHFRDHSLLRKPCAPSLQRISYSAYTHSTLH